MSSLEAVYDMTWAEFQIRLFAYKRMDLYDWQKLRESMWITYIATHQDPKRMVRRKEQFLPLGNEKATHGVSEEAKQRFLNEFTKYQEQIQAKA